MLDCGDPDGGFRKKELCLTLALMYICMLYVWNEGTRLTLLLPLTCPAVFK